MLSVRARVPSCLAANECRCAKNTVPRGRRNKLDELPPGESSLRSDVTHEDKARVCNWHCYFISTSILKQ